ncbi:OmpA family protein [Calditrichota bacterium]
MLTRVITVLFLLFTLLNPLEAVPINEQLSDALDAFEELKENDGALLSPRNFSDAEKNLDRAKQDLKKKKDIASIQARIQNAMDAIEAANKVVETANQVLSAAIEARIACNEVGADEYAPKEYVKAEGEFKSAVNYLEADKLKAVGQKASAAEILFREAELIAIKVSVLGKARDLIKEAEDSDADSYAPATMQLSRSLRDEASSVLDSDRSETGIKQATIRAKKSEYEAEHAIYITRRAKSLENNDSGLEAFITETEGYLKNISDGLEYKAVYDNGFGRPLEEMAAIIQGLRKNLGSDIVRLNSALADQNAKIDSLQTELEDLKKKYKSRVGKLKRELEELATINAEVDSILKANEAASAALEMKIQGVRNTFSPNEAEVLMQDDDLVIRVVGLSFDVGAATLQPSSFELLGRVQKVLHDFLNYDVEIEGHTDSQGSDNINMELSRSRAEAVLQYLLGTSDKIIPGRIKATGYGEGRPVASNETSEGRAKNRRIEIIIKNVGG